MKVKNLVLFGFILSAISYLSKQIEEENSDETDFLKELEEIDLEEVKKELGSKLESAIVEFGDVVGSIAKIGSDAFDKFLSSAQDDMQQEELLEKLKEAVEVSEETLSETDVYQEEVEDAQEEKEVYEVPENTFDDLLSLLKEVDLEEYAEEETSEQCENCECECEECDCDECECDQECECEHCGCHDELEDLSEQETQEANDIQEFELAIERILKEAQEAIQKESQEDIFEEVTPEINYEAEINEEEPVVEAQEETAEEYLEGESLWHQPETDASKLLQDLCDTLNAFSFEEDKEEELVQEEKEEEVEVEETQQEALETTELEETEEFDDTDEMLKEIEKAVESKESEEEKPLEELFDELLVDTHAQIEKEVSKDEIDEIFKEILEQENVEEASQDDYVEELIEELPEEEKVEEYVPDVYDQINELYPYLTKSFVRSVYDLKENIAEEYPYDTDVIALHRVHFNNLEDLRQFVEIVSNHKYGVNVDEMKMIVDLFKVYRNTDGKILTNIFEIANQAKLLHGEYEGYRVEVKE